MSEKDKDNFEKRDFEFIQEQVIEKKRRKIKKRLFPFLLTISLAILFGLVAAITFVIAEPALYKFLHKEEETKTPVTFPTQSPDSTDTDTSIDNDPQEVTVAPTKAPSKETADTDPVIQKIDASLEDYLGIYDDINEIAYEANKTQVCITSSFTVQDLFGNTVEKTMNTSGLIVANNTSEFLILASLDCVKDANSVKIRFSDNTEIDAVLQDYETELNLAILAVAIEDIPKLYMNSLQVAELGESYALSVGTPVIALGNPNGHIGSMDIGIITSKGSWTNITDNRIELFNTNMDSNAYSDGVIVNMKGQIIGIITRTLRDDVNEELSTAIGISELITLIEQMGNLEPRIYFGIKADDMTEAAKKEHNITNGIYVSEVQSESPAFEAGLKNGDIILSVNEQTITNTNNFYSAISAFKTEQKITVKIQRTTSSAEREMELTVVLAEKVQ